MLQNGQIAPPKLGIEQKYVEQIKDGRKTVEVRIYKEFFRNLPPGKRIEFVGSNNPQYSVSCRIRSTKRYNNLRELLQREGFKNCLPNACSLEEAVSIYQGIPEYFHEVSRYNVLAIRIDVIP